MYYFGILLAHLIGDYLLQTHWMAENKTKRFWPAALHAALYTVPYIVLVAWGYGWDLRTLLFFAAPLWLIGVTHYYIDRYRLAKYLMWFKNQLAPKTSRVAWAEAKENSGYPQSVPTYMSTWLMIVADNTLHLIINTALLLGWAAFL